MKGLLVFLLLISFIISIDPHIPDVKDSIKPVIENELPDINDLPDLDGGLESDIEPDKETTEPISGKCRNGKFENEKCICNLGYRKKGQFECVKNNNKCIGGINVNGVCKCPNGQLPQNGSCQSRLVSCPYYKISFNGKCILPNLKNYIKLKMHNLSRWKTYNKWKMSIYTISWSTLKAFNKWKMPSNI